MRLSKLNANTVRDLAKEGTRVDGRDLMEFRDIDIQTGYAEKAEGSAFIKLGKTKLLAGVKLGTGTPFSDKPKSGVLMTLAELIPMASPRFEGGPPGPEATEVARVVDRAIRESQMIDLEKLYIEEDTVWMLNLDFYTFDMDGNLFDAAALAGCAALRTAKIPKYEDGQVIHEEAEGDLPVKGKTISCTFAKVGDALLLDPNQLEELTMDARLTIGLNENDHVCSMQKGGLGSFTQEEVNQAVEETVKQAKKLRKVIP